MPHDEPDRIYHLALADEWKAAHTGDDHYRRSTLGRSLAEVGFIHCALAGQVQSVADAFYRGRPDVVLLTIDPSQLRADVRLENLDGGDEEFPHIYGPLPVAAVVDQAAVAMGADGRLELGRLLT